MIAFSVFMSSLTLTPSLLFSTALCSKPLTYSQSLFSRSSRICSDRGECVCGKCECKKQSDRQYQGKYCECDNISCPKVNGVLCNGFEHECNCGKCICDAGWTGEDCTCKTDTASCKSSRNSKICSSNGICECGVCRCSKTDLYEFKGHFCEQLNSNCKLHSKCVLQNAIKKTDSAILSELSVDVNKIYCNEMYEFDRLDFHSTNLNASIWKSCRIMFSEIDKNNLLNECWLQYYYTSSDSFNNKDQRKLQIYWEKFNSQYHCPKILSPMAVGGMVLGGLVIFGLFMILVYYFFQRYLDKKEFEQFERDIMQPNWKEENRLFKGINGNSESKKSSKSYATVRFRLK